MKKFLHAGFLFVLPPLLLFLAATAVEWHCFRRALRCPDCTVGLIGDSHPQCAVDPAAGFPELANFAQRTSKPMVWRAKLPVILDENPQIKTFLIEISPENYFGSAGEPPSVRARFTRGHIRATSLLDIMKTREMGGLPNVDFSRNVLRGIVFPFVARCVTKSEKSALQEGFYPLDHFVKETPWWGDGGVVKKPDFVLLPPTQNQNRREIEDCIRLLQDRNVQPVLLTCPLWAYWKERAVPADVWDRFVLEMHELAKAHGCPWIDMSESVPDDAMWADATHLNRQGAACYTVLLADALRPWREARPDPADAVREGRDR